MPLTPKSSIARVLLTGALCMGAAGCHHLFGQTRVSIDEWKLDQDRYVRLKNTCSIYPEWADSDLTYSELSLRVFTDDAVIHQHVIDRREAAEQRRRGPIPLGDYEARTDESRQRLWIVDKKIHRVIVTHDCQTKTTRVPGEGSPARARLDEGDVLARRVLTRYD